MQNKLTGTGVALVTPMKSDQSIDYDGFKKLLQHVANGGVDYLVVNGTTGESATTSFKEKEELVAFVVKENTKKLPVVVGIGGNNTADILEKIEKTNFTGVTALLSVSPYYNKPSQEGIYQHYKVIAEASPVPVIIYNVPGRTGSNITAQTTIRLSQIKNIIGTKEASGDFAQCLAIRKGAKEGFVLISGDDILTVPMISIGATGVISVLANIFPSEFSTVVSNALEGKFDEAAKLLLNFIEISPLLYTEGSPVAVKQCLELMGVCDKHVRLPYVPVSAELKAALIKAGGERFKKVGITV